MLTITSNRPFPRSSRLFRPWAAAVAAAAALIGAGAASAALPPPMPTSGALAATRLPSCSWDRPGVDPFMGDVVAAVDRYDDIPVDVRQRLKQRMAERRYDDIAVIRRDTLTGGRDYDPALRDMHFGAGRVCGSVSRSAWLPTQEERGLVYCEGETCVIVPTVCRNVSRVTRRPAAAAAPVAAVGPGGPGELLFAPPGAGLPAADGVPSTGSTPFASFADASGPTLAQPLTATGGETGVVPGPGGVIPLPLAPGFNPVVTGPPADIGLPLAPVNPVPEPASWALLGAGLAVLSVLARRRRARAEAVAAPASR